MINWINDFFGISNDVSVPTLISIIVFLIGAMTKYIFETFRAYNTRKNIRKTVIDLVEEVVKDLKIKEKYTAEFFPTISTEHKGSWFLPYKPISYLDTFFEMDFNEIYYSFRRKAFWSICSRKIRDKAFHRVWSILRYLKFIEERLERDLENLINRFDTFHKEYNKRLDQYRKYHDDLNRRTNGIHFPDSQKNVHAYLMIQDNIWQEWQQLDEKERVSFHITYKQLVEPILDLNRKNSNVIFAQESDDVLLACTHQYIEMENTLSIYKRIFKGHFFNYREARRILKKCGRLIK